MDKKHHFCRTDSVQPTSSKEITKNANKGDMVKIENHCTKKIRLGDLNTNNFQGNVLWIAKMCPLLALATGLWGVYIQTSASASAFWA